MKKSPQQLERYFKGVANFRRIQILDLIARSEGISVEGIAETLDCNVKTISEHTRRLVSAGLVNKKYSGRTVKHSLMENQFTPIFLNLNNIPTFLRM